MDITRGNVTVRLYSTPAKVGNRRYPSWTVAWFQGGVRQRKRFSSLEGANGAQKWAEDKAEALNRGYAVTMTADEVASYNRAYELARPTGQPLEVIAHDFAEVWKQTGGVSLRELGAFWQKHHTGDATKTVPQVRDELLAVKKQDGLSPEYVHDLDVRLGKFADSFPVPLINLEAPILDAWLRSINGSQRSRKNYRRALATLFRFAKERRYLPKDWDELPKLGRQMAADVPVEIYTPEELKKLLAAARNGHGFRYSLLPLLVIGAFAGVRTAEIQRLDWAKVGEKYIDVTAKRTRSQSRRLVPILPTLKEWLKTCRADSGPVCRNRSLENATAKLAELAGVKWKHNGLRHSFISYRVAIIQDVAQVALECGNSPQMIFQHYRERVAPEAAKEWFKILPQTVKPVAKLSQRKSAKVKKPA